MPKTCKLCQLSEDDCVQNNDENNIQQTTQTAKGSTDLQNQLENCEPELIQVKCHCKTKNHKKKIST